MKPRTHTEKAQRSRQGEYALKMAEAMERRGLPVLRVDLSGHQPRIELASGAAPTVREHGGEVALNHITPRGWLCVYERHGCLVTWPEGRA